MDSYHGTGILISVTGDFLNVTLAPEEIGLALLPPSLFETLSDDEIGLFFLLYESAAFFPVAGVSNTNGITTVIGSPVIAATVVSEEQTSFPDLSEPVIIAVRLNPVPEGVSCTSFIVAEYIKRYAFISCSIAQNITRCTCVSWDFDLAGNNYASS